MWVEKNTTMEIDPSKMVETNISAFCEFTILWRAALFIFNSGTTYILHLQPYGIDFFDYRHNDIVLNK